MKFDGISSTPLRCECGVPQGSVLRPQLFTAYVATVANVIAPFGVSFHQFADNTQLYINVQPRSSITPMDRLDKCSCAVLEWFTHSGLSLNPTKTEFLNIGNGFGLMKNVPFVQVAGCQIKPADDIQSLDGTLDCHQSFDKHGDFKC